jgi:hypothetical protein
MLAYVQTAMRLRIVGRLFVMPLIVVAALSQPEVAHAMFAQRGVGDGFLSCRFCIRLVRSGG